MFIGPAASLDCSRREMHSPATIVEQNNMATWGRTHPACFCYKRRLLPGSLMKLVFVQRESIDRCSTQDACGPTAKEQCLRRIYSDE